MTPYYPILPHITPILFLIISPVFAGETKVYTNADLEDYKTGQKEEETRQYKQKVIKYNRMNSEQYDTQNKINEIGDAYKRDNEEQRIKKDRALKRIRELEEEKAKDKTERDFIGGYVGRRNAEERHKRAINREVELDNVYREAGLSRERDLQKRTEEAERKPRLAEPYDSDEKSNYRYKSFSGKKYQYDLSNPSDKVRYEVDPAAQLRDSIDPDPRKELDRGLGQYGGGGK